MLQIAANSQYTRPANSIIRKVLGKRKRAKKKDFALATPNEPKLSVALWRPLALATRMVQLI